MSKKIALIGCGIWGLNILKELVTLHADVHAFESDSGLEEAALQEGASSFRSGLPSVEDHFDGLVIATPSSTHRQVLEELAGLSIPVFLEKPLTIHFEDALALRKIALDKIFLMHIWLYHPGILLLKEIAQSGELGAVKGVRSTRANWTSPRRDTDTLWNLAPHDITIAKAILGYIPEPRAAIAEKHDAKTRGFFGVMGNDPWFVFEVSNRYERKIREVRVHCEKGIAILEDEKVDFIKIVYGDAESDPKNLRIEQRNFDRTPPLRIEIREFLNYLDGGKPPRSNLEEGIEVVKTIHQLMNLAK